MCLACGRMGHQHGRNELIELENVEIGSANLIGAQLESVARTTGTMARYDVPATTSTEGTIGVGGFVTSDLVDADDHDWFAITLEAGRAYEFSVSGLHIGELENPNLALRNATGGIVGYNDDDNDITDARLQVIINQTGTYYLDVGGAGAGEYRLVAHEIDHPDPLDAITWNYTAPSHVRVYFVNTPDSTVTDEFGTYTSSAWTQSEMDQAMLAFQQFSNVADITFTTTQALSNADFVMIKSDLGSGLLGYWGVDGGNLEIDGRDYSVNGHGMFAENGSGFDTEGLAQGGYGFLTLIHEIGHGLGLAHPHDNGGGSEQMVGVFYDEDATGYTTGEVNLNQGVNTVMSYVDGWASAPHGTTDSNAYGWSGTAMALDIAALQQLYGANTRYNNGDTVYELPTTNAAGTYYASIWDAGGNDTIINTGFEASIIDLRTATLAYDPLGGGAVSYVTDIHGGFTIANGVHIENAIGGSGDDTLIASDEGHYLSGRGGDDTMIGGAATDYFDGGAGTDMIHGNDGDDWLDGGADGDSLEGGTGNDTILGGSGDDTVWGQEGADVLDGGVGDDMLEGGVGDDTIYGGDGDDTLAGREGNDFYEGGDGLDVLDYATEGGNGAVTVNLQAYTATDTFGFTDTISAVEVIIGTNLSDVMYGTDRQAVSLEGGAGDDQLWGYATAGDHLIGGDGIDLLAAFGGSAVIEGGNGTDYVLTSYGDNTVSTGAGNDEVYVRFGANTIDLGDGINRVWSADLAETSARHYYADSTDYVTGGNQTDYIYTGRGNDTLIGNNGSDWLAGGRDHDTLTGGADADRFVFANELGSFDVITDFEDGLDRLDFTTCGFVNDFSDLATIQVGQNLAISWNGGQSGVTINNLDWADFSAADILV